MWALGVVLFTMLYGQFPFYDSIPQELFRKIKAAEYSIPEWVSPLFLESKFLIGKYCGGPCFKKDSSLKYKSVIVYQNFLWIVI